MWTIFIVLSSYDISILFTEFKNVASTSSYCMATDKADIVRDVMENMLTKLEADDGENNNITIACTSFKLL